MHDTAMEYGQKFFQTYLPNAEGLTIVDIGAQDVSGSLRSVAPASCKYVGVDFVAAKGVDIVIDDPYVLPFEDNSLDVCVSTSCFEHAEFFWLSFNEILRVLKPHGLFYLNAPSNGAFHRYPVDCWRFYPDSGVALQNWGRRSGYPVVLLESFTGLQKNDIWNDYIAVFLKDEAHLAQHPARMLHTDRNVLNGFQHGSKDLLNVFAPSQDQNAHRRLKAILQSIQTVMKS